MELHTFVAAALVRFRDPRTLRASQLKDVRGPS